MSILRFILLYNHRYLFVALMDFTVVNNNFLLNGNHFSFQHFGLTGVFSSFPIWFIPSFSDLCCSVPPSAITLQTCRGAVETLVTLTRNSPRCQWTWLPQTSWSSWTWTRTTSSASPTLTPSTRLLQINMRPTQTGGLVQLKKQTGRHLKWNCFAFVQYIPAIFQHRLSNISWTEMCHQQMCTSDWRPKNSSKKVDIQRPGLTSQSLSFLKTAGF